MNKLRIKKGDTVKVLSGKDRGRTGKVLQVFPGIRKAVVENVNMHTKFERSKKAGQPGKKITFSSPMSVSKLQFIDPNSGKPTRVGYQFLENKTKQRIAKESGKAI
ncbi:MAG: 50S ribosomal protein L24 [Patescibacteria group bacterium]